MKVDVVGTQSYAFASGLSATSSCTSTQLAPYLNGSKNLTFSRDTYSVPSLSYDRYFLWGGWKGWIEWQAGTGAGCRRQPIPVAAEAGAFGRRVRSTQADEPLAFLTISDGGGPKSANDFLN